jgi:hypothetical protein
VAELPKHRSHARHLEHQPFHHFGATRHVSGQQLPSFFRQVNQDGPRFEDGKVVVAIANSRNLAVGIDRFERRQKLIAFANVNFVDGVRQFEFFEQNGRLAAIGGGVGVQVNHGSVSLVEESKESELVDGVLGFEF